MKTSKMLELVENLKVGEKVVIEKFKDHLFVEKKESEVRPFENGDIVYQKEERYIGIFKDQSEMYLKFHVILVSDNILTYNDGYSKKTTSFLATEIQKQLLFDRLAKDNLKWNSETKQMEYLNEPNIGDTVIMWNAKNPKESTTIDTLGKIKKIPEGYRYFGWANVTDNAVKWDGTKEQFDRIRNGGNK